MTISEKDLSVALELAQSGDLSNIFCAFGNMNPSIAHYGVKYICVKYGQAEFCCEEHGHPGAQCCIKVTKRKASDMSKKKTKMTKSTINTICPNTNTKNPCAAPRYYCSKDKLYYCFDHTHPYAMNCCRYSDYITGEASEFSFELQTPQEFSTSEADHGDPPCSKKDCKSDAPWRCKKDKKNRCAFHAHQGDCCDHIDTSSKCGIKTCYEASTYWCDTSRDLFCKKHKHKKKCCTKDKEWGDLGEEEENTEEKKPLKVVKFANS